MKENWLFIKTPDHYGETDIIEFDENAIKHFSVEKYSDISLVKKVNEKWNENLTEIEHKFVNPNRIRFFRKGKIHKVISETESVTEDCIFENDYEKLIATETKLTESEIQNLRFELVWNGEKLNVIFNEILDSPAIQEMNKRMGNEGSRIVLEKLNETLFISLYSDKYSEKLIPIKYIDKQKVILYGFPKEPYEVNCKVLE
ncbi:hypothetical protein ABGT15_14685 [Flavobacterium enshiense]|uniref:hypothetical protein n=1 Tax=Flavobacterium enshiense TaxID=1341165 RepID=UPI00345C6E06